RAGELGVTEDEADVEERDRCGRGQHPVGAALGQPEVPAEVHARDDVADPEAPDHHGPQGPLQRCHGAFYTASAAGPAPGPARAALPARWARHHARALAATTASMSTSRITPSAVYWGKSLSQSRPHQSTRTRA